MALEEGLIKNYVGILKEELVPALGCTEPIAIAYAAAKARAVLEEAPRSIQVFSSGNIIKNVQGVTVPNTGGLRGIEIAAAAGVVGGDPDKKLEVLSGVTPENIVEAQAQIKAGMYETALLESGEKLHIIVKAQGDHHSSLVEIAGSHTHIVKIERDGQVVFQDKLDGAALKTGGDRSLLNVRDIVDFARTVDISLVEDIINEQIKCNTAISQQGLKEDYGVRIGKLMMELDGDNIKTRAKAAAVAGSDARMSGCTLPVVINSGSGNQGLTVSMPVIEYCKELQVGEEQTIRALLVSNLVSIHIKTGIGSLSAYCGAVSAASGSGAGIAFLHGASQQVINDTITNTLATSSGLVCDGAKPSCAGKIAEALGSALLGYEMAKSGRVYGGGEGIVKNTVEETIQAVGRMAARGMEQTDVEILNIMINN